VEVAALVARKGLSVRETEALVRRMLTRRDDNPDREQPRKDPNIDRLEQDLAGRLGARVHLQHTAKGRGKLVINYNSLDELDGILEHIR
jgi:ParB family transcriptional regulator, chromosome partitioning protein